MKSGRKLLIQSNTLWVGIFLGMAAFFLLAFAVQIGAAPLILPTGTPQSYLPIIYGGGGTPTPASCTPSSGYAQLDTGSAPYGSAVDEVSGNVFVANHGTGQVTVLNGTTIVGTVSTGGQPWGVAYNPVNKRIYVTDEGNGRLLVIDPTSLTVEKELGGVANPRGVAINRNTGAAYVASPGTSMHGQLKRYTLADVAGSGTGVPVDVGNAPTGVVVDSRGWVWATTDVQLVRVIWPDEGSTTTTTTNVQGAYGIAYNASTQRLYVTTGGSSSLIVYNVSGDNPVPVTEAKTSPEYNLDWLALNASTGWLYVAGRTSATADHDRAAKLWAFNTSTNAFSPTPFDLFSWNDNTRMRGVSLDTQGRVYVSSEYLDRVFVINDCGSGAPPPTPTPSPCVSSSGYAQLDTGSAPYGSAVDEVSGNVFVANHGTGTVTVLNGTTIVGTVSTGGQPWGVAYNPVNKRIYVTDEGNGRLLVIDPTLLTVEKELGGVANPRGVAINRNTGAAYVASPGTSMNGQLKRYTLADVAGDGQEGVAVDVGNAPTGVVVDSRGWIWMTTAVELVRVTWPDQGSAATTKWDVPGAFGIAYNAGTQRLYVTTGGSSSLIVYNVSGDTPVPVTEVKTSPEYNLDWLALNATTGRLYVAGRVAATVDHGRASKLWVFNTSTNAFGATPFDLDSWNDNTTMRGVSVDKQSRVYASSEYTDRVYVFGDCGGGPTPTPTPVSGCDPTSAGSVQLASGSTPYGSAANEDTGEVFVANHGLGTVSVLSGTQLVATVANGGFTIGQPWGVAYNPVSKKIYVTDEGNGQLLIVDPASRTVEKALGGVANPRGLAIDRNTGTAYVASPGTAMHGRLIRYTLDDVENESIGTAVDVGNAPTGVVLDGRGWIWATTGTQLVRVIWPDLGSAATKGWTVTGAYGIVYNATNQRLYVTTGGSSELLVYDIESMSDTDNAAPIATYKTAAPEYNLYWLALNPNTGRLFVGGRIPSSSTDKSSRLWVFNTLTDAWSTSFLMDSSWNASSMINGVSFEPKRKRIYVSSEFSDKIYVFDDTGACP